ncbi:hypothetical protein JCM8097_000831 [Rhodosporidiobolus ruineniae]
MSPSRGSRPRPFPVLFFRPHLFLLLSSAIPTPSFAAVSSSDLLAYVGGTATGQTLTTVAYSLTMVANSSSVLVSLSYSSGAVSDVGWLGFGTGTAMTDSDIIVLWPTVDGSSVTWTLSHRTASSTTMPTLVGSADSDDPSADSSGNLRVVASLSSASGSDKPAVVTFERPLTLPDGYEGGKNYQLEAAVNQEVIYACGTTNPGKGDQDAEFEQHALDSMGATYMDLSTSFTADTAAIDAPLTPVKSSGSSSGSSTGAAGSTATSGGSGNGAAGGSTAATGTGSASSSSSTGSAGSTSSASSSSSSTTFSYANVILVHGICAGQGFLVTPLTLGAGGLALWAVSLKTTTTSETYAHKTIGFVFIGALVVQDALGIAKHLSHSAPGQPRSALGWLHIFLGVALIAVGFYQVHLGI